MMVVRNEIDRIKDCLEWHLPYIDQVVICDQESDDGTWEFLQDLATEISIPIEIWQDKKWGYCEPSKQVTADKLSTDWILYVDADERFPKVFLEKVHEIIDTEEFDSFRFPRYNYFDVQVFDDNVPITPKWLTVQHPAKDPQTRLTRKSLSKFPVYLHHRVRVLNDKGEKRMFDLPYPIEHRKTVIEQWGDQKRYAVINDRSKK